jgi:hypothetical protein
MMRAAHVLPLALILLGPSVLSGCAVAHVAGDVVEGAVNVTGAVVGGAADVVTTSEQEKYEKAKKEEKKAKDD